MIFFLWTQQIYLSLSVCIDDATVFREIVSDTA